MKKEFNKDELVVDECSATSISHDGNKRVSGTISTESNSLKMDQCQVNKDQESTLVTNTSDATTTSTDSLKSVNSDIRIVESESSAKQCVIARFRISPQDEPEVQTIGISRSPHMVKPGAFSVFSGTSNTAVSSDVQRLIAKSRGDASSVIPSSFHQSSDVNQDEVSTAPKATVPGAFSVSSGSATAVSTECQRLIAKSRGDASSVIPSSFHQSSDVNQDEVSNATKANAPGAFSVSSGSAITVSTECQRLIAKSRGDASSVIPSSFHQTNDANQDGESSAANVIAQGASFSGSNNAISNESQRLTAQSRGDSSSAISFPYGQDSHSQNTPGAYSFSCESDNAVSSACRRLIAKSQGDASYVIPSSFDQNLDENDQKDSKVCNSSIAGDYGTHDADVTGSPLLTSIHRHGVVTVIEKAQSTDMQSEYDICTEQAQDGIAIATTVEDDDAYDTLPSAIEFDPDSKLPKNLHRQFRIYTFLIISTISIVIVGATFRMLSFKADYLPELPYRVTLGIRENIERVIEKVELDNLNSPYRKALDWIMFTDPMMLTPESPNFFQRYIMAYFYFATSQKEPWDSGCAPSTSKKDDCTMKYIGYNEYRDEVTKPGIRWLSKVDECKWIGVTCDNLNQITTIDVSGGFTNAGAFPQGITLLPVLHRLKLNGIGIEGQLPISLWRMKNLLFMEAIVNQISGTLANEFYECRSLIEVGLRSNSITGLLTKRISNMQDMIRLDLARNFLTGTIPNEIGELGNLKSLALSSNKLTGKITTLLTSLKNLVSLDLARNDLTGAIPDAPPKLNELFLEENFLTGTIPESLFVNELMQIAINNNMLHGTISPKIFKATSLDILLVQNNHLSGELPERYGQSALTHFEGQGNFFNGTVPTQLCELAQGFQMETLVFDCLEEKFNSSISAEIICPPECCTMCCKRDGEFCLEM